MKKYLTNVLLLLCLLTACSKSDGGNDEGSEDWMKDFAPTSIRNKGLCLSMGETMNNWYIKILQKSQNEVLMVANDASWKLSDFYSEKFQSISKGYRPISKFLFFLFVFPIFFL